MNEEHWQHVRSLIASARKTTPQPQKTPSPSPLYPPATIVTRDPLSVDPIDIEFLKTKKPEEYTDKERYLRDYLKGNPFVLALIIRYQK